MTELKRPQPASLFVTDDAMIDLSRVIIATWQPGAVIDGTAPVSMVTRDRVLAVYLDGLPATQPIQILNEQCAKAFQHALATYHETRS